MPAAVKTRKKPDHEPQAPPGQAHPPAPTVTAQADAAPVPAPAQPQAVTVDDLIRRLEAAQIRDATVDAAVAQALAAPFEVAEVKFKPQAVSGNRALAVPFVDARTIQDRLDDVLGVMGWQDSYECLPDGSVVCRLKIRLGSEWIVKEDVGGQSEQPDEGDRRKAAFSDALKRAAVKFGVGRYLYRQTPTWVDYDPTKRKWTGNLPILTGSASAQRQATTTTTTTTTKPQQKQQAAASAPAAADGQDFLAKLQAHDQLLAGNGLCRTGELVKCVAAAGKHNGYAADMTTWGEREIDAAREVTRDFVERMKLHQQYDRLTAQKGVGDADVLAKLKTSPGVSVAMLSAKQLRVAIARLEEMPDKKSKAG